MKKVLLVAVNAKYIHSCPAIYSLRASSGHAEAVQIAEFTINDRYQDILAGILAYHADIIGFSCYIWNTQIVTDLIADIRALLGDTVILYAGGPEASYGPETFLGSCDFVMCGEGEKPFALLMEAAMQVESELGDSECSLPGQPDTAQILNDIASDPEIKDAARTRKDDLEMQEIREFIRTLPGCVWKDGGRIVYNPISPEVCPDMDAIPFLYDNIQLFDNRIIYYESSRGCPFRCTYCLSSIDKTVRFRNMETVKRELQFFIDHKVPQVKFVDRTFNCDRKRAMEIWQYIADHDNGITNFHFEIGADLLGEEEIALLRGLRPALIQLEIGIQSTNPKTVEAIQRTMDFGRLRKNVLALREAGNINLHVDLIAGLPYEGLISFAKSFNDVYALHADQLQLGFLKVLKGTVMEQRAEEYGIRYSVRPPYEVLATKWISYEELDRLRRVCDVLEMYYNSQQFIRTLRFLEENGGMADGAFAFFDRMADFFVETGYNKKRPSAAARYEVLDTFVSGLGLTEEQMKIFREYLRFDRMLHFHRSRGMARDETFDFGDGHIWIQFDYSTENPVSHEAGYVIC